MAVSPLAQAVTSRLARYPSLDPQAVLAVASREGLGGGIGDGGHAFGPFQLNNAGGVITGKFPGQSPEQIQQWASSPQGIDYALGGIDKVAGGLHGSDAINAIVSRFERPANIPGEIAGALTAYGLPPQSGGQAPQPSLAQAAAAPSTPARSAVSPQLLEKLVSFILGPSQARH